MGGNAVNITQTLTSQVESNPLVILEKPEIDTPGTALTPMGVIDRALASNATPETLAKLLDLQERYEAGVARKAFNHAMAAVKAEIPVIQKNREVGFAHKSGGGDTNYRHEDLGQIARTIDPILAKHGLSYRYRTSSEIGHPVSVTCIVSHQDGHSEENTLHAGRDDSGKKNSIQQIGSTITYLQRYTLKAALGLASSYDNDGADADATDLAWVTKEQAEKLRTLAEEAGADIPKLCQYLNVSSIPDLYAKDYQRAVSAIEAKRRKAAK